MNGAGDGIRTRDIKLGKLALYQLSYSRESEPSYRNADGKTTARVCVCSTRAVGTRPRVGRDLQVTPRLRAFARPDDARDLAALF